MTILMQIFYSDYPSITRVEQRRKYKTEFDKDYSEYRQLHTVMEKARKRFANLQDELRKVHPSDEKYRVNILLLSTSALFSLRILHAPPPYHTPQLLVIIYYFFLYLQEIQNKILLEYKENNNNSSFQDKKKR